MEWAALRGLEVAAMMVLAVGSHLLVARLAENFVNSLAKVAGGVVRTVAAVGHAVAGLVYIGFAAVSAPFGDGVGPVGEPDLEGVVDAIGVFALLVALVQVVILLTLQRVANRWEPWPSEPLQEGSAS